MKQSETQKIRENPKPEIRRRIYKALKGDFVLDNIQVDGAIFNRLHTIRGAIVSENNDYLLEFKISEKI